jgi:hypothetical protein
MTESDLLREVLQLAADNDVLAYHVRNSTTATSRGYPDLTLCGRHHLLFAELKSTFGKLEYHQRIWRNRLQDSGASYELWTPFDLRSGHILETLKDLNTL